jgi:DNA-directed RNA polymerase sigma subunit (sigma70/sigma32)
MARRTTAGERETGETFEPNGPYAGDVFGIYMKQVGAEPLLTKDQEMKFGARIAGARKTLETLETRRLPSALTSKQKHTTELVRAALNGLEARGSIITHMTTYDEKREGIIDKVRTGEAAREEIDDIIARCVRVCHKSLRGIWESFEESLSHCPEEQEAEDRLVRGNLRLVVSIAKEFPTYGRTLEERIEDGNIGLIRGVMGYDPTQFKTKFSTYATPWIRQTIISGNTDLSSVVRVPRYIYDLIPKCRKEERNFMNEFGYCPLQKNS